MLILGSLGIQGCIPVYTGVPAIDAVNVAGGAILGIGSAMVDEPEDENDVTKFYQDGHDRFLRDGEKVEYYGGCNSKAKIAITNDRVMLLPSRYQVHSETGYRLDVEIYWSIEHIEINRIDLNKEKNVWGGTLIREIHLYPYDSDDVEILYCNSAGKGITQIAQAIQKQIDQVNDIREQFGITIPEAVTTAELEKLNEPVVSELKARRKNSVISSQDQVVIRFPFSECPNITGKYYDRAIDQIDRLDNETLGLGQQIYGKGQDYHSDPTTTCEVKSLDYSRWMSSRCSLRHWFNSSLRDIMLYDPMNKTLSCPSIDMIEFVTADNHESIKVTTYRDSTVESTYTIDMKTSGFMCKDRIISFKEHGRSIMIFLSKDGSLNIKDGGGEVSTVSGFVLIPAHDISENIYKWGKVDKIINPYKNCPEAQ